MTLSYHRPGFYFPSLFFPGEMSPAWESVSLLLVRSHLVAGVCSPPAPPTLGHPPDNARRLTLVPSQC